MAYDDDFDFGELDAGSFKRQQATNEGTEIKEATVSRVAWQQPGNDFKILKMDNNESWKGVVGESTGKGWIITAEGHWEKNKNPRFPDTFIIDKIRKLIPGGHGGLKTWLMDRLPEIGEARAEALVKQYPSREAMFEMIEQEPHKLTQISGITEERAKKIQQAYAMYKHELVIVPQLVDLGIEYLMAQKAARLSNIQQILDDDPFELVNLPDWSFQIVKDFVLRPYNPYGMSATDPRVIRAYARDLLEAAIRGDQRFTVPELREGGNCFFTRAQMLYLLRNYQMYSQDELQKIVSSSKYLVWLQGGFVLLQEINSAENTVSGIIHEKLTNRIEMRLLAFEGTRLDDSQKAAASAITQLPIAVMTGGPGTGKTTTLKAALDAIEHNGESVKLASPTGKAAKRMTETTGRPAQTIHKLLEWGPLKDEFGVESFGFRRNEQNPIEADVVVIDESSMLDIYLARDLFSALGGARIILVGDEDQLPPVGPGQVLTDIMKRTSDGRHVVPTFRLTNTYRQAADSWVIDNAKRIINGQLPSLKNQSDFQFLDLRNSDDIIRAIVDIYIASKEKGQLEDLQVLCPMKKPGAGASTFEINLEVQQRLNPNSNSPESYPNVQGGDKYRIFEGDKVIFTKNNADLGLVNGDTGYVEQIIVPANVMETRLLMRVDGLQNQAREDGLYELQGDQFRALLLAYAITIHKSQGSEWKEVIVVMDEHHRQMLKRQLLYTAVTRTSRFLRIVGQRSAVERAATSPRSNLRQTLLFNRLVR